MIRKLDIGQSENVNKYVNDIIINNTHINRIYKNGDTYWGNDVSASFNYKNEYFTIEALEQGNIVFVIPAAVDSNYLTSFSYSKDKTNWTTTIIDNTSQVITINVDVNDKVYFKGVGNAYAKSTTSDEFSFFNVAKYCNISGNIMSLLYGDNFANQKTLTSTYTFAYLIGGEYGCHVLDASNLILPATTLTDSCYRCMFKGAGTLTIPPKILPATVLAENCYRSMFETCYWLTSTPKLPATTLANYCYMRMFYDCDNYLTTISELPATTLADYCYYAMFYFCGSIVASPELKAATLAPHCYEFMFGRCSSLNEITMLATDISATDCLSNWVYGVASNGTFYKDFNMNSLPTGDSGIPTGWTVQDV